MIEWVQLMAASLRAGNPVAIAIAESVAGPPALAPKAAVRAAADLERGRGARETLESWRVNAVSDGERLVATALLVALERGADPAPAVDSAIDGLHDDVALSSRLRVLTAQARASAAVLVGLPIAFGGLGSVLRGELIYRGTAGLIALGIGLLLDLAGFAWMRRLRRRLR